MRPGDFFEWCDPDDKMVMISPRAEMYSTTMQKWIPMGGHMTNMIIAAYDDRLVWINAAGVFDVQLEKDITPPISVASKYEARVLKT